MATRTFIVDGKIYHDSKVDFKLFLKKNHLKWTGTFDAPRWSSKKVTVKAIFVRDPKLEITTEAQFILTGAGNIYYEICEWIIHWMKGKEDGDKAEKIHRKNIKERLAKFDCFHKPNMDYLKSIKAPDSYVKYRFAEYEKKRAELIKELNNPTEPEPTQEKEVEKPKPVVGVWKS